MRENYRVLVIDDASFIRKSVVQLLIECGFESENIVEAEDGSKAIKILLNNPQDFHLILCDLNMPHFDGFEILKFVRSHKDMQRQKIIMITTESEKDHIVEALKSKPDGYLLKSSLKEKLEEEVNRVLRL